MVKAWWDRLNTAVVRNRYEQHERARRRVDRDAEESLDRARKGIRRNPFR